MQERNLYVQSIEEYTEFYYVESINILNIKMTRFLFSFISVPFPVIGYLITLWIPVFMICQYNGQDVNKF